MRENGVIVDDKARRHGGTSSIKIDNYVIPLNLCDEMTVLKNRRPTEFELANCDMVDLTSSLPWDPKDVSDTDFGRQEYLELLETKEDRIHNVKKTVKLSKNWEEVQKYFLFPGEEVMKHTLSNTT